MNPLNAASNLTKAVTFPFTFLFVVGLCAFINFFTSPGHWWFQWVAFGMGIALICIWARALKTLILTVGIAGVGYFVYRWWKNRASAVNTGNANTSTRTGGVTIDANAQ